MHLTLHIHLTELSRDLKSSICLRPQVSREQTVDANMNLRKLFIMDRYFHIHSFSSVNWIILKFLLLQGPSFFPTSFMCNCTHPLQTLWHIFSDPLSLLLAPAALSPLLLRRPPPSCRLSPDPGASHWAPLLHPPFFMGLQRALVSPIAAQAGFPGQTSRVMNRTMNWVPSGKYVGNYKVN